MVNPIVVVNVTEQVAPTPNTLQKTGALISQGGTTLGVGDYSLLTQKSDLTPLLADPLPLSALTSSGLVATATAAATTATSGTYDGTTGLVTLNLAADVDLSPGESITVSSAAGTGSFAAINGTFVCAAGTNGTTATYTIAASLTMTISTADVQANLNMTIGDKFRTTIAGALPAGYNGLVLATVASASTFTYALASTLSSPATGTPTFTPRSVGELQAMVNTFFAQGNGQAVYVLELGAGEPSAGVAALSTFIDASAQFFYAYLVPESWDVNADFLDLIADFEAPDAKTYFFTTTTTSNYGTYTALMKCLFLLVPAPGAPLAEFSCAAPFRVELNYAPSSANKVTPFEYSFVFGVTPWPTKGNAVILTQLKAANCSYIGSGAEGGISDTIVIGGNFADGNPVNFWYATDWAQINVDLSVANAIINGSNNPTNPLDYNQNGINRLQQVAAQTMANGITYGLVLNPVLQTALDAPDFTAALDAGTYANDTVINAIPFTDYVVENPGDYKIGQYAGYTIGFTPIRGFDKVIFNLNVSNFG